jgi:hypothetical protein
VAFLLHHKCKVCFEIQPRIRVQIFKLEGGLFEMMMMGLEMGVIIGSFLSVLFPRTQP